MHTCKDLYIYIYAHVCIYAYMYMCSARAKAKKRQTCAASRPAALPASAAAYKLHEQIKLFICNSMP